ncbi:MAG TPA: calcium/sodium antiporter [Gemmatimonadales bacterium]|nr:calcium/sodium antiporter [Gemmatimonadales bacterium]
MLPALGALLAVAAGVAVLAGGGEILIRGAVSLARLARISTAVIGLTVVAMGTSMPELAVSLLAALRGSSDIAMGNVVGSNIFNVAAIVGLCALVAPIAVHMTAVKLEWPFMFIALFVCLLLARDGRIDRLEAGFFLVSLTAFTIYMVRLARAEIAPADEARIAATVEERTVRSARLQWAMDAGLVIGGLVLLFAGGRLLVWGAVELAELAGLSERVIGLTVVAAGTSMPELAASLVAARRGQQEIALANIIGSNIFNVLGILGIVALVQPQTVHPQIMASDNWWMVGTSFALFPLMITGMRINRFEGGALFLSYVVYLYLLF